MATGGYLAVGQYIASRSSTSCFDDGRGIGGGTVCTTPAKAFRAFALLVRRDARWSRVKVHGTLFAAVV
jgi:hypothetical protein